MQNYQHQKKKSCRISVKKMADEDTNTVRIRTCLCFFTHSNHPILHPHHP